ncbi:polysaccharide deacetylase family protein, partial [Slackia isoflavoniconvertens]|uniref:polysaccharide deacetylase family protein n=2 Tax=Slackia isoflavoniconvertens TaxID=572010 RepID=UPI003FD85EDA
MSHDNDFPENHDALRTRTHARPRPAKKPLAAQEGQRIPTRGADERAYPVETPGRSSEPRASRAQVPTDSRAPRTHAPAEQRMPTSRKPIDSHARHTHAPGKPRPSRNQTSGARASMSRPPKTAFAIAGVCVALALVLLSVVHWQNTRPIDIMVNGQELQLPRTATVNDAFEAAGSPATAGNMLDIDGELLQEGSGTAYTATLDGHELDPTAAADTPLDGHMSIDFANGVDVEEPSNVAENQPIAHGVQDVGHGPLHIVTQKGQDGSGTIKTGQVSGRQQVIEVTNDPVDTIMKRCYPDTQGEKVVALTFDDGPWDDTNELLDVLRDNGAKA